MLTSTHALSGAAVGALTAVIAPELLPAAVVVGLLAGVAPDLDLLWTHRKTTHFPVYGAVATLAVGLVAAATGGSFALLLAVAAAAFSLHPLMDVLCGGVEVRPWEATSERAVYDHARRRWLRPRRLVRYAGAPEELLLTAGVGLPVVVVTTDTLRQSMVVIIVVSGLFIAVRRRLAPLAERLFADGSKKL
ncbi:MAG: putative membrane-bound metal-dependent hydrolase (DUF457) [uncultured archaeon A07HN63]|nr:MAG: putative membrane-bound metal-dependent hydrolase (DUF457) [uncultured archaeon A07HN63]